jgi:hypothetical protein
MMAAMPVAALILRFAGLPVRHGSARRARFCMGRVY